MATEMAWNQVATDLGCITPPHTVANITGLKNLQDLLQHPVYITLCRQTGMQVSDPHNRRPPTQSDIYQMMY